VSLLDAPSHPVHVVDRGSGEAVVFLHAFPLQAAMWDYQVDALEATHRCVTIDLPGFGQSPEPEAPATASMARYADMVADVLRERGIESATFVGASMGGYLVMALLRRHRSLVSQVVLAGTKARSDDAGTAARRTDQQEQLRSGAEVSSLAKGVVEGLMSSGSMSRPDLVEYIHALADGSSPEGWIAALEAMKGRDDSMLVLREAGKAGVRAMVMVGELDRVTPIADAMSLRSSLKGELVIVPGVGHLPNIEDPWSFNEALARFLGVTLPTEDEAAANEAPANEAAANEAPANEAAVDGGAPGEVAVDEAADAPAEAVAEGAAPEPAT
jgi:pimeloyl-ACP methyl ester carboxylesterase